MQIEDPLTKKKEVQAENTSLNGSIILEKRRKGVGIL